MPTTHVCPNPICGKSVTLADGPTPPAAKCPACRTLLDLPKPSGSATTPRSGNPPAAPPTDAPERIGRFEIVGRLGAGAFGTVYRARDPQLDREVALKVPNAGVLTDPKRVERFLREAKAAAQLRHPNIVPVFDAGRDGDLYFIASAFVDGTPLSEQVGERGMDIRRAAEIVRTLAGAVGYAHEQGIVHRDIKPSNVMLDSSGAPHLMDFGLAARADEAEKLTSDGAVMGTPAYMSPEQAGGQRTDPAPAWDQYALGVVLYELLTGRTPFSGPPAAVIYRVLNDEPPSPRSIRTYIPRDVETICLKAMTRDADGRYASCAELAEDLRRWLAGEPIKARKRGPVERAVRWVRENDTVAALGAVTFAAMALGTLLAVTFAQKAERRARDATEHRAAADDSTQRADAAEGSVKQRLQELDALRRSVQKEKQNTADLLKEAAAREAAKLGEAATLECKKLKDADMRENALKEKLLDKRLEYNEIYGEKLSLQKQIDAFKLRDNDFTSRDLQLARKLLGVWSHGTDTKYEYEFRADKTFKWELRQFAGGVPDSSKGTYSVKYRNLQLVHDGGAKKSRPTEFILFVSENSSSYIHLAAFNTTGVANFNVYNRVR